MKKIASLFFLLCFTVNANANDEKIVESKISQVTVYSQGAQIYRTASYAVSKGVTEVIIEGVSPTIDVKSLQVKATGAAIILDTKYMVYYPKPESIPLSGLPLKTRQQITALEDSIKRVNYEIQSYQDELDVLVATKNILQNNGAIRGQGKVNDSIQLLQTAIDYYSKKMMEINERYRVLGRSKANSETVRNGMNQRLQDLRNFENNSDTRNKAMEPRHRVIITIKSDASITGKLDVSYLVSSAGWTPMYDLRSEISVGKVNLNYKAQVYQNTGVDWNEVPLTISTNNPYQNKTKPELHPWYVDFYAYNQVQSRSDNAATPSSALRKKAEAIGYTSSAPAMSGFVMEDAELDATYAYDFVEVVDHVISAEFRIDLPYSIKSNNQKHMVLVKNVDLAADYKYYTVPKYDKSAYLVAQISKLDELQLVPAKANIYFDGAYMGETYLDPTTMDDTLHLSLGKDPNIIVKRTLLEKESKERVVGTKMERSYAYSIEVKNLKSKSIEIIVQDQVPVTTNPEIEISSSELSKGTLIARTGIVEWNVTIKPNSSKEIFLTYVVKHDKDKNVVL